ncbi:hypothetical protein DGMP_15580 [Desulfomarina profundi]|uniref:DUF2232 domain-containing protein n=1 Tax=Desulfomarina profundi TaxID=2772557 RepID=A0A8D5FHN8_9BACT|nr:DUF2232 domain-containing protein [Desulfomarina profundi]BCL60865.1 hypothetical protein DGMP_15580 [Desulfomarina profundi]
MSEGSTENPEIRSILRNILLFSIALVLPGLQWTLFGWLHMLLPVCVFYLLGRYGIRSGNRMVLSSLALALLIYLLARRVDFFLLSVSLLPVSYVLIQSARRRESPAISGLKGVLVLAACWILAFAGLSIGAETSFYAQLLLTLDKGIGEALQYYRTSENISSDSLLLLETTLQQMKVIIPVIMPAMLGSFILLITWFTMVSGNKLVTRTCGWAPWEQYRYWQLPDKLIWIVIISGMIILVPTSPMRSFGINVLILLSIIYCFQGLSIAVFFLEKWNIPIFFRSFFYIMIIFQSFGTVLLLVVGIGDIWLDFRKLHQKPEEPGD